MLCWLASVQEGIPEACIEVEASRLGDALLHKQGASLEVQFTQRKLKVTKV